LLPHTDAGSNVRMAVGVDVEAIADFRSKDDVFVQRNFTADEQAYCRSSADPAASFAARWCAKEAVVKALSSLSPVKITQGPGAPLRDIEIRLSESGAPTVQLHGVVSQVAAELNLQSIAVSLSHADQQAIAQVVMMAAGSR